MTARAHAVRQSAGVAAGLGAVLAVAGWLLFARALSRVDGMCGPDCTASASVGLGVGVWLAVGVTATVVAVVSVAVASLCHVLEAQERTRP